MEKMIPILTPADVELRVQQIVPGREGKAPACILLVYKDARVDMRILDQVYGPMNWQRQHEVVDGQLFCKVSVWDEAKGQWVTKSDVGTESQTEAEKGRSSDSFKRACFNWGIGRELYSAPFIYIPLQSNEIETRNGRNYLSRRLKMRVSEMVYDSAANEYTTFTVVDQDGTVRFSLRKKPANIPANPPAAPAEPPKSAEGTNTPPAPNDTPTGEYNGSLCFHCDSKITPAVREYSVKHYGKPLCIDCQKKATKIR